MYKRGTLLIIALLAGTTSGAAGINRTDRPATPATATAPSDEPASRPAPAYVIDIDTGQTPELTEWAETTLRPVLEKWYPIIVRELPGKDYLAPARFSVTFVKDMKGVADTSGTRICCAAPWFKRQLHGEAIGAVVHEMVHVVQQYRSGNNPGWLVEGVADYVRWFQYEPPSKRPRVDPVRARYTDSYRTTAAFLNFVTGKRDKDVVMKLNAAMRQGKYEPGLWQQYTGKTIDELWAEYVAALNGK